jgi:hypothetical protein
MKKVFTSLAILFLFGTYLSAQTPESKQTIIQSHSVFKVTNQQNFLIKSRKRSAEGPSWFSTTSSLGAEQNSYSTTTLFPDTNALFVFSNGVGKTYLNSIGLVFDPRSEIFDGLPFNTTKFSNYTVDSLRFYFVYTRFNTDENMNDTIVLTTFDNTSIDRLRYYPSVYAGIVDYSNVDLTAGGAGAIKTKIILTKDDTSRLIQSRVIAVNRTIMGGNPGRNHFGATVTYLPAYRSYSKVEPFDTVVNFMSRATDSTKVNSFRILYFDDENRFQESDVIPDLQNMGNRIYNHGIVANQTQRYRIGNPAPSGYYPSTFFGANFIPAIEFLVQSPNTAINTVSSAKISDIYPNPSNNQDVVVEINSDINSASTLEIMDMSGRVIRSNELSIEAGFNSVTVSTSELAKGIYFVNVKGSSINSVSKLVIE